MKSLDQCHHAQAGSTNGRGTFSCFELCQGPGRALPVIGKEIRLNNSIMKFLAEGMENNLKLGDIVKNPVFLPLNISLAIPSLAVSG